MVTPTGREMMCPSLPDSVCLTPGHDILEGDLFVAKRSPEEFVARCSIWSLPVIR